MISFLKLLRLITTKLLGGWLFRKGQFTYQNKKIYGK